MSSKWLERLIIPLVVAVVSGVVILFIEYHTGLFYPTASKRASPSLFGWGLIGLGLIGALVLLVYSKRTRSIFELAIRCVITLKRAWRPIVVVLGIVALGIWILRNLLIQHLHPLSGWIFWQYVLAITLVALLALLLTYTLLVEPWRRTRRAEQSRVDSTTPGLQSGLIRKIDFEYLQKLRRDLEEDFLLSHRDPTYGYVLRIQAEQDFCLDYDLASDELKQACKTVEFVFRFETNFAFYTIIKVRGQQPPDEVRLYCKPTEGTCPAPRRDQRYLYSNGVIPEYTVHVPTDQLNDGWALMSIDLLTHVRDIAALEGREWELDELVTLRLKGEGIRGDVAYIGLYSEPVE